MVFRAAHSVAEPSLWRGMSSSSASYAIGDGSARLTLHQPEWPRPLAHFSEREHIPTSGDFRSALGLDDDDDDDSPGGGSFDDGSFGGSEGAAPTPAGIDGAIAEEDEGEDASPAK